MRKETGKSLFIKNTKGHKIYCEITGNLESKKTIIFAHGNGNCLDDWKALGYTAKLGKLYKLILMDALGYGKSDKPYQSLEYTAEQKSQDVISVLDALKIEQCHFFGNSIGGSLGFVLAAKFPARFLSFVIGSAHPYGTKVAVGCNIYPLEFIESIQKEGAAKFVDYLEKEFLKKSFPTEVRKNFIKNDLIALAAANKIVWPDYSAGLDKIKVPVLLFAGEFDPVSKFLPEVARKIPCCKLEILKGKDHPDAYWECEPIVSIVIDFIASS